MVVLTKINVTSVSAKLTLSLRAFSTQGNLTVEAQCMFNIGYVDLGPSYPSLSVYGETNINQC